MTTSARGQFIRNKDEFAQAKGILKSDLFAKILIYARAEMALRGASGEEMNGALKFEQALLSMATDTEPMPDLGGLERRKRPAQIEQRLPEFDVAQRIDIARQRRPERLAHEENGPVALHQALEPAHPHRGLGAGREPPRHLAVDGHVVHLAALDEEGRGIA